MSILTYNGGTVIGMAGKNCVAIACDKRFGAQFATIDTNFTKIYELDPYLYIGLPGLVTDAITFSQRVKFRKNMFELRENRKMTPSIFSSMVSNILYEKRFGPYFIEPVIAALDPKTNEPWLSSFDSIGCEETSKNFLCCGTGSEQAFGCCEAFWEQDLEPDALFETISQSMLSALERDASSGWGSYVYVIEKDKVTFSELKGRMD